MLGRRWKSPVRLQNLWRLDFSIHNHLNRPSSNCNVGFTVRGWRIKEPDGSIAIGSGPIRALALKPKDVFEEIGYKDVSDKAVLTLESNKLPSDALIEKVTTASGVSAAELDCRCSSDRKHRWINAGSWKSC